ncbi:enoyl-CoA hydratase-related protein [Pararhodobacter zhoushanensis]|uniref:enoyl-CoA hydratase-related protein n=1 Tax=Pararhodobacter zhoushanensis TaxID=2479545 RepID=UPI000F8D57D6|nr:enoyl-CoA hydratase/isomerase family protein [Pararhodobacter zhoushanensis]
MNRQPATDSDPKAEQSPVVARRNRNSVAILVLSGPDGNRMSPTLITALHRAVVEAAADPAARAIVLTSSEDFCLGPHDDLPPPGPGRHKTPASLAALAALCTLIERAPKPVVCALRGRVSGGGLMVALAAAGRVSGPRAVFTCPELRAGRVPPAGGPVRLAWRVGAGPALRLMNGAVWSAEKAQKAGLIDAVHKEGLLAAAINRALGLADGTSVADPRPGLADANRFRSAVAEARAALPAPFLSASMADHWLVDCVEAAQLLPPEQALDFAVIRAADAASRPEARALAHLARAARRALHPVPRPASGAVIVALDKEQAARWVPVMLHEGAPVILMGQDRATLADALETVAEAQLDLVEAGRLTEAEAEADWTRVSGRLALEPDQPIGVALADAAHIDWLAAQLPDVVPLALWSPAGERHPRAVTLVPAPTRPTRLCEIVSNKAAAIDAVAGMALQMRLTPLRARGGPLLAPLIRATAQAAARLRAAGVSVGELTATGIVPPGLDHGEVAAERAALPLPVERLILLAVVNAAAKLLEDGHAARPSDVDLALVLGAGWPNWRGGPLAEADALGPMVLRHELRAAAVLDAELWTPEPMLDEMIRRGWRFEDLNAG